MAPRGRLTWYCPCREATGRDMGAWGYRSFENDDAIDWAEDLAELGVEAVEGAFRDVVSQSNPYPETSVCCRAIAAVEVVAALRDRTFATLPKAIADQIGDLP